MVVAAFQGEGVKRSTDGLAPAASGVDGSAKIGYLELTVEPEEEILGLEVAVDNDHCIAVVKCFRARRDALGRSAEGARAAVVELIEELAPARILEDEEN